MSSVSPKPTLFPHRHLVWKLSGSAHPAAVCSFPPYTDIPRAPCPLFVGTFIIFHHLKPDVSES